MQTSQLSIDKLQKLKNYEGKRRMDAFRIVFEEYKDTIGEWEIVEYKDAGTNWRETSKLRCECGRQLRYQYIVSNRNTAEILHFGINHLKLHTALSDEPIREVLKKLRQVDNEIEEMEDRINENWNLDMEIPEEVLVPEEIKSLLDEGLPLSSNEEKMLSKIVQDAKRKQWEVENSVQNHSGQKTKFVQKRRDDSRNQFKLHENEKVFVDGMIQSGVGSAMVIAKELHESFGYNEYYLSGRVKIYPLVVFYLEHQVEIGILSLLFNHGTEDRVYQLN